MESIFTNVKYAVRVLLKRKAFSLVVILTLAIGIGASSSIFSVVNSILLRPMPFPKSEQLVIIETVHGGEKGRISQREIADILEGTTAFEDVAGYVPDAQYNLTERGAPEEIPANICQQNLFSVLGVKFVNGTAWPKEFDMRRSFGIVITEDLWKRKFDNDKNIVNETITLDAYQGYTVFGVVPTGFDFPKGIQMFRSATIRDSYVTDRNARSYIAVGRLRGDTNVDQARRQLETLARQLTDKFPETNGSISYDIMPLRDLYVGSVKSYLLLASVAALFVLLISCINVSNLLIAASAERDKEIAIRTVMGARKGSLVSQFLTESLLLAGTGGIVGIILNALLLNFFKDSISQDLPHWIKIQIDVSVLVFAVLVSVGCGLLAGWMPALKISRFNLSRLLKESRGSSGGTHRHRLRKSLVVAELTLSIILLIGTLLVLKSFELLKKSELGFNPKNVLTFRVALPWRKYGNREQAISFYRQLIPGLRKIPGVTEVALNDNLPLSYDPNGEARDDEFSINGQSFEEQKSNPYVKYQTVTPSYREMFDIPLIAGRWITEFDDTLTTPVAVISKSMAERVFKKENPIGKQIKVGKPDSPAAYRSIIGIAGDVRHDDMRKRGGNQVYLSRWQVGGGNQFVLLKTDGPPMQFAQQANKAVWAVDGDQSSYDMKPMTDRIDQKLWQDKVIGHVFSLFAVISVIMASIGIYSVMSYAISLRTKEFGVRRVMGAATNNILGIVLKEVLIMAVISLTIGIVLSVFIADSLSGILYGVSWKSFETYAIVGTLAFVIALAAALLPAFRATRINPVKALKNE